MIKNILTLTWSLCYNISVLNEHLEWQKEEFVGKYGACALGRGKKEGCVVYGGVPVCDSTDCMRHCFHSKRLNPDVSTFLITLYM